MRRMRVALDTEARGQGAEAVPESEVQVEEVEYLGRDGKLYRLVKASECEIYGKVYPVYKPEPIGAVAEDEGR